MLTLLIRFSALSIAISYAIATSCHDLQQSQLVSLNERMNQMINTISSLLSKPTPKSSSATSPTVGSQSDHTPNISGYETPYHIPPHPPAYSTSTPIPHTMFVSPPYAPVPSIGGISPVIPNAIIPPLPPIYPAELSSHPDYVYPGYSNVMPGSIWTQYSYDQYSPFQYSNARVITTPLSAYSPVPYPQPPYPIEYTHPYSSDYPPQPPTFSPKIPSPQNYPQFYPPSYSQIYMPPKSLPTAPPFPNYAELQPQYT